MQRQGIGGMSPRSTPEGRRRGLHHENMVVSADRSTFATLRMNTCNGIEPNAATVASTQRSSYTSLSISGLQSTKCCVTCDTCEKVTFNSPRYMLLRNYEIPSMLGMRDCRSLMRPCL